MIKIIFAYFLLFGIFSGCQEKSESTASLGGAPSLEITGSTSAQSAKVADDFSDLKPKDDKAGCSTEEEQAKKLLEEKKPEEIKLQGATTTDCVVE